MKTTVTKLVALICLLLACYGARAEDGITNVINGFTTNYPAGYMIGTNGSFNALIVTNAGLLRVTGNGVVGNSSVSSNNYAVVTGAASFWSNSANLYVGNTGSFSRLTISSGGRVNNDFGYIGYNSSNNVVVVSDAGSAWTNLSDLSVGRSGSGNQLIITNGGRVSSWIGWIGEYMGSSRNLVTISGTGSVWRNSGALYVGYTGSFNRLIVTNGGRVFNTSGTVGENATSSNNWALVTGAGSMWSNSANLHVGYSGSFNRLTITNSGQVLDIVGYIGFSSSATNNSVLVTGAGSLWTGLGHQPALHHRRA